MIHVGLVEWRRDPIANERALHRLVLRELVGAADIQLTEHARRAAVGDKLRLGDVPVAICIVDREHVAGLSSDPPYPFTTASYSQSLAGFLDVIGIERAHILGLSWGGWRRSFIVRMSSDSAMSLSSAEVDTTDLLPNIDVATLVLKGDDDRRSPLHIARQLHASIPNAQLAIISNAGHVSNMEQPDVFNSEVRRFCLSADVA